MVQGRSLQTLSKAVLSCQTKLPGAVAQAVPVTVSAALPKAGMCSLPGTAQDTAASKRVELGSATRHGSSQCQGWL